MTVAFCIHSIDSNIHLLLNSLYHYLSLPIDRSQYFPLPTNRVTVDLLTNRFGDSLCQRLQSDVQILDDCMQDGITAAFGLS